MAILETSIESKTTYYASIIITGASATAAGPQYE